MKNKLIDVRKYVELQTGLQILSRVLHPLSSQWTQLPKHS